MFKTVIDYNLSLSLGLSEVNILRTIIHYKKYEMLKHPLCELFLHLKWKRAHVLYYVVKIIHIIFTLLVVLYTLVYHGELKYLIGKDHCRAKPSPTSSAINDTTESLETTTSMTSSDYPPYEHKPCNEIWRILPILITVISLFLLAMHSTKFFQNRHSFDWSLSREFIMEDLLPLLGVLLFAISQAGFKIKGYDEDEGRYQIRVHRYIAAWLVLICCHSMAYTMSRDSENAIFIEMMFKIMGNLWKFGISYIWLFIGWFAALHVTMGLESSSFRDISSAFSKTITMFTGDLGFESDNGFVFVTSFENEGWYGFAISFLYIIFIFEMSVVLMNQLIGLAITNIQELAEDADGLRLVKEVMFQKYMESLLHLLPSLPKRCTKAYNATLNQRLAQLVTKDIYNGNAIYCVDKDSFDSGSYRLQLNIKNSSFVNNNINPGSPTRHISEGVDASVVGMSISQTVDIKSIAFGTIPSNVVNKLKCLMHGNEQKIKEKEEKEQNDIKKLLQEVLERIEKIEHSNSSMHMEDRMGQNDTNKLLQDIKEGMRHNNSKIERLESVVEAYDTEQISKQNSNA